MPSSISKEAATVRTPIFVRAMVTDAILEPLVARAIDHDTPAWHRLVTLLFPGIEEVAGRFRNTGRFSTVVDERRTVAVAVIDRLHRQEFDGLRRLRDVIDVGQDSAWPWVCRITQRKAYDHVRDHAENLGPDTPGGAPCFAEMVELSDEAEDLLPASVRVTDGIDAHHIWAHAESVLSPAELAALRLHVLGDSDKTIAETLHLPAAPAAYGLWHRAVDRLRYRFRREGGGR
jgi:DNA-directed RNA polymerase specialized sigma24 family protein